MSFFFEAVKKAPAAKKRGAGRGPIPIASLQALGCEVCPRSQTWGELKNPKLEHSGTTRPLFYVLGSAPDERSDRKGEAFAGEAGEAIRQAMPGAMRRDSAFGYITQCRPLTTEDDDTRDVDTGPHEIACCRNRVVDEIERLRPRVIVGVGDKVLTWATKLRGGTALQHRGSWFPVKVGTHVCWFVPIIFPNYAFSNRKSSPYETVTRFDLRNIMQAVFDETLEKPKVIEGSEIDSGLELISGHQPGDFKRLERILADFSVLPQVGVDYESNGLRVSRLRKPEILTASVGTLERCVSFAVAHPEGWGSDHMVSKVMGLWGEFVLYSNNKIAHNLALEMEWTHHFYGAQSIFGTEWDDTMAMCHCFDERDGTKSLEVQSVLGFGFNLKAQSPVDVSLKNWWMQYPLQTILRYNALDSKWTEARARQLQRKLAAGRPEDRREHLRKVALAPALVLTESKGMPVSIPRAEKMDDQFYSQIQRIERDIRACPEIKKYGQRFGTFSPTSPDHTLKLLKEICDRPEIKRVEWDGSESMSTDEKVLSVLPSDEVPSAALILEHRGIEKLRGTLKPIINGEIVGVDGQVHSKYGSMTVPSGRLNCKDPNAQNYPKRKHKEVRAIFYAEDDEEIEAIDYGQIEFRAGAMVSLDPVLMRACWTDYDVHKVWAEHIVHAWPKTKDWIVKEFDVDWDEKGMKTLRQEAKNKWVFPCMFGASVNSRGLNLHLPDDIAQDLDDMFWDEFKVLKKWQIKTLENWERTLTVSTLSGRLRRGPLSKNEIINHPIQGTAFDVVGAAHQALAERAVIEDQMEYCPSINVHDDLTTWLKKKTREERRRVIVEEMCKHRFDWVTVPLLVEVSCGPDWANLVEVAKFRSDQLFGLRNPYN